MQRQETPMDNWNKKIDTMNRNNDKSNPKPPHMSWKEFCKNATPEQKKQRNKRKKENNS